VALAITFSTLSLGLVPIVPRSAEANAAPSIYEHVADVSSTEHRALVLARRLKEETPRKTMDYRVAKKVFGSSSRDISWRRQYAAGWKLGGGKVAHVSKAELKKIEKVRKRSQSPVPHPDAQVAACTGVSGHKFLDPKKDDYYHADYLNSCETNRVIRNLGWCVGAAGLIGAMAGHPGVGAIMALFIFGCGGTAGWVSTAQANSDLNAVIVMTGDTHKYYPVHPTPQNPSRYQLPVKVKPQ
jgi:hypothetical protein